MAGRILVMRPTSLSEFTEWYYSKQNLFFVIPSENINPGVQGTQLSTSIDKMCCGLLRYN